MASTPAPRNDLNAAAAGAAGHDTGSQIIQLNVLAKAVAEQPQFPTIDVDGLRDLNKHLATAQDHANAWLNSYSGQCWNTLQGLISFGETFDNLYSSLASAAQNMAKENQFQPGEISRLIASLQALQSLVQGQLNQCQKTYEVIATYNARSCQTNRPSRPITTRPTRSWAAPRARSRSCRARSPPSRTRSTRTSRSSPAARP